MSLRNERRVSSAILAMVHALLAAALVAMMASYWRYVSPETREALPPWLEIGFPVAICIGALHFLRRSLQAWRRFRNP